MILTCPQCSIRYLLPAQTLAPEGRRVKCTGCGNIWFQLPDPDELGGAERDRHSPLDDIPESVKPIPDEIPLRRQDEDDDAPAHPGGKRVKGYAAAAVLLAVILGGFFAAHKSVIEVWPASAGFFSQMGYDTPVPGEGLVFDSLAAEAQPLDGAEAIVLSGQVINLTDGAQAVPLIEASLRDESGAVLEQWYIRTPETRIAAEGILPFSTQYTPAHKSYDVNLRFVLKKDKNIKTAAEAGDNTQAPPADAQAHPHGGAESEESPAPSSARSHPEP